jgi:hypothetical protein
MGFEIGFVPIEISDESLTSLRKLATMRGIDYSPLLAAWITKWCNDEAVARVETPDKRLEKHALGLPMASDWTDTQLADALHLAVILSYLPGIPGDCGNFVDRLAVFLGQLAADRLRERDPATP